MRLMQAALLLLTPIMCVAGPVEDAQREFADENYEEVLTLLDQTGDDELGQQGQRIMALALYYTQQYGTALPLLQAYLVAQDDDAEVLQALSEIYLTQGDTQQALNSARRLAAAAPGGSSDLLLARAMVAAGDDANASRIFARLGSSPNIRVAQSAGLEQARMLLASGNVDGARAAAQRARALRPDSFAAYQLSDFLSRLEQIQPPVSPLTIALGFRVDYDDNVLLLPDDPGDFVIATDQSDTRLNLLGDIIYRRALDNNLTFFAEGHVRLGELMDLSEYSSSNLRAVAGLGGSYTQWGWRAPIELGKQWIDGDGYRDSLVFNPGAYYRFSDVDLLYGYLRFQDEDFDGFAERPSDDPSGDRSGLGAMYLRNVSEGLGELRLIGEYSEVDADGRNVAREEWRLYGYFTYDFAPRWQAGVGGQYLSADYDNVHDIFLRKRDDDLFDFFAHIAYELSPEWEIRGQLTSGERDSNIDIFGYDRTVISVGINWKN